MEKNQIQQKSESSFKNMDKNNLWLIIIVIAVFAIVSIAEPSKFLKSNNFQSMAYQFPEFGIMALGMMICMIAGGIDLSVVGISNLSGIIAALIITSTNDPSAGTIILAILAALLVGAGCGLFNGFLIGYLRIPAMLVTLCGLEVYSGLGLAITKGPAVTGIPESFQQIGNGLIGNTVPISLIVFIGLVAALWYILKYTQYGQQLYMMGANPTASKYAGINNLSVTVKTHIISGVLAAISGIIICSHYGSAKSDYGSSYTLLTLLIVILGGINPNGGKGKIAGVVLAILILQIISSAFSILRFNSFIKTFVFGLILIVVMIVQYWSVSGISSKSKTIKTIKEKKYEKNYK